MGPARMHIAAFLLVLGLCNADTAGSREIKVNDTNGRGVVHVDAAGADAGKRRAESAPSVQERTEEDGEEEEEGEEQDENLPVLPPIILLDFDNGTSGDNATDEKSKRTVNNGLGYGFDRNSLLTPRKYNYYFPAGKTGTTVSIEESVSPFLPRTIIERVQPVEQRPIVTAGVDPSANVGRQGGSYGDRSVAGGDSATSYQQDRYRYYDSATKTARPPVFGLRTKLTKTTSSSGQPYRGAYSATARPPPVVETAYPSADYRDGAYASTTTPSHSLVYGGSGTESSADYVTPASPPQAAVGYTASSSSRYTYVTPSPPSYATEEHSSPQAYLGQGSQHTINVHGYPGGAGPAEASTPNTLDATVYLEGVQPNPHGYVRGSAMEPSAAVAPSADDAGYVEAAGVPAYADLPRYTVENGVRYENKVFWKYPDGRVSDVPPVTYATYSEYPPLAALQAAAAKSQETSSVYESASTENSVLSQGPAQFPMAPESGAPPSPFISADSLSRLSQQQVYRLGYQNLVGQKQQLVQQQAKAGSGVSATYAITTSTTTATPPRSPAVKAGRKNQKSRYSGASPGRPASRYLVNSPNPEYADITESTPRSALTGAVLASSAGQSQPPPKRTNASGKNLDNYSNLQYSDLLNYNPSISQYIKNPASILNVQPTFVQAGNSLIPVIILRVDGVPPIQPKAAPNVNLKALLQQYLVQYAKSIAELTRPSNYDLGGDQLARDPSAFLASPLRELARLAQNGGQDLLGNPTDSYVGRTSYEVSNLELEKRIPSGKYGQRTAARPKVKSVQIVEDPRFPNYKAKN